ncbi:hypothetical protein MTP03_13790 [Tsukamurella sp. PLM1]|nr:hypothetical protein MTP03_13790 [Tsukamurella sp. PLM1]
MTSAVRVLLASRNVKKLRELRQVVADAGIVGLEIVGLDEVAPSTSCRRTHRRSRATR